MAKPAEPLWLGRFSVEAAAMRTRELVLLVALSFVFWALRQHVPADPARAATIGSWARTGDMRPFSTNEEVLLAGTGSLPLWSPNTELYDPTSGTWALTGNMDTERTQHTMTLLTNGKLLLAGACPMARAYSSLRPGLS